MDRKEWELVEALFHEASAAAPADRAELLRRRTQDARILLEVEELLMADASSHNLLDAPTTRSLPPGTRLGQYELLRILGGGAMGTVYLARRADRQFEKQVAIKLVNQPVTEILAGGRFERERQVLANLDHPNIARLLDAGVSAYGHPYLVMEFVDGLPLDAWLRERRPTLDECLDLWLQVAGAAAHAHRNLVVHRDIKPSNILITPDRTAKLVDFGIAKLMDSPADAATQTQAFTPSYASPEQLAGLHVTTASDVYSLALVLGDMVRTAAFGAVPRDLEAIIAMATRAEPERRYLSVDQFAADLGRFRTALPVLAQPESLGYRASKFVRRNKWTVLATTAAAASLLATAAVALVQARRAVAQLARANKVTAFLSGVMGFVPSDGSSTLRSKGSSLRVVDLVDAVSIRMERELASQPEAEATIRYLAATAYNEMGLFTKAEPHVRRAVELFSRQRPPHDPERVDAEILEGTIDSQLGNYQKSEQRFLETRRHWRNPTPYTVAALETVLGVDQQQLGKLDEAEKTLEHCIGVMKTGLGEDNPWLGIAMSNLALVYQARGEFERQRHTLEKALVIARGRRAESAQSLGWVAFNLAVVNRILDVPASAKASALEAIDAFREAFGPDSAPEAGAMTQLAWAKVKLRESDAEPVARKALAIEQAKLPAGHPELSVGLTWLGFVLLENGKISEALPLLEEAVELRRKAFPAQEWRSMPAAGFLGEALIRQRERERGLSLLRNSRDLLRAQFGAANPRTRDAQARLDRFTAP